MRLLVTTESHNGYRLWEWEWWYARFAPTSRCTTSVGLAIDFTISAYVRKTGRKRLPRYRVLQLFALNNRVASPRCFAGASYEFVKAWRDKKSEASKKFP
jgi:hypothetical protein